MRRVTGNPRPQDPIAGTHKCWNGDRVIDNLDLIDGVFVLKSFCIGRKIPTRRPAGPIHDMSQHMSHTQGPPSTRRSKATAEDGSGGFFHAHR